MIATRSCLLLLLFSLSLSSVWGFYLPGIAPRNFAIGQEVRIQVNALDSVRTQMPFGYYSLSWTEKCRPGHIVSEHANLGEILSGDLIETSLYEARMRMTESCKILCRTNSLTNPQIKELAAMIEDEYRVNLIVDNLPAAMAHVYEVSHPDGRSETVKKFVKGFPLGYTDPNDSKTKYIYNHVRLSIYYHVHDKNGKKFQRIVGFEVMPFSVRHKVMEEWDPYDLSSNHLESCTPLHPITADSRPQQITGLPKIRAERSIIFTYDVEWKESPVRWASRWDIYLAGTTESPTVRWLSIISSMMVVVLLSLIITLLLSRTIKKELSTGNDFELGAVDKGWKVLSRFVFRTPEHAGSLCVFVGTGIQLWCAVLAVVLFAMLGFLTPASRGSLVTAMLLLYVVMGSLSGYSSTRLFRGLGLTDWRTNTLQTAMFFPFLCFSLFFFLDLVLWGAGSSGAVPIATLVSLLVLWMGISTPLVYVGSYTAYKQTPLMPPFPVDNTTSRAIPSLPWYLRSPMCYVLGGLLPFAAVFFEIYSLLSSVWLHQHYILFSCLAVVFLILVFTCVQVTVIYVYFLLGAEDYQWWWKAFILSGSVGGYLYLYSVIYFFTQLEIIKLIPGLLYFSYMSLVSFAVFIMTGTAGLLGTLFFVHWLYSQIKTE